jgi:hypothetical protein
MWIQQTLSGSEVTGDYQSLRKMAAGIRKPKPVTDLKPLWTSPNGESSVE